MNDEEFLRRFEAADLPEVAWHHREHLRVAYLGWSAAVSQTSRSTTTGSPSTVAPRRFQIGTQPIKAVSEKLWPQMERGLQRGFA